MQEYREWKEHLITQRVFKELRKERERLVFNITNGGTLKNGEGTGEATAKTVGIICGIDLILQMTFEGEKVDE